MKPINLPKIGVKVRCFSYPYKTNPYWKLCLVTGNVTYINEDFADKSGFTEESLLRYVKEGRLVEITKHETNKPAED